MSGRSASRRCCLPLAAALLALAGLASPADASVTFGDVASTADHAIYACTEDASDASRLDVETASAAPAAGTVTKLEAVTYRLRAVRRLLVLRPAGSDTYTVVGRSPQFTEDTAETVRSFDVDIAVHKGDVLGAWAGVGSTVGNDGVTWQYACGNPGSGAKPYRLGAAEPNVGDTAVASQGPASLTPNVRATLTPETTPPTLTVTQNPAAPTSGLNGWFVKHDLDHLTESVRLSLSASDTESDVSDIACT